MSNNKEKSKKCKNRVGNCEEDYNGFCYYCQRNMLKPKSEVNKECCGNLPNGERWGHYGKCNNSFKPKAEVQKANPDYVSKCCNASCKIGSEGTSNGFIHWFICEKCNETCDVVQDHIGDHQMNEDCYNSKRCMDSLSDSPVEEEWEENAYDNKHCPNCNLDFKGIGMDSTCPECETKFTTPPTKVPEWEEEFEEKFLYSIWSGDHKNPILLAKDFTKRYTKEGLIKEIKSFISQLLQKQRKEIVEEIKKLEKESHSEVIFLEKEPRLIYTKAILDVLNIINNLTSRQGEK